MLLIYLILALLIIFLIVDYKRFVIFLAVFAINLSFFSFSIAGSIFNFMALVAIPIFFITNDWKKIITHPLILCGILPLISVCISMPQFTIRNVIVVIAQYVFPVILYYMLQSKKDIAYYIKCMKYLLVLAVLYCFYEEMTQTNPIMKWCSQHPEQFQWMTSRAEQLSLRFSVKRALSFFPGEAAFATVCIYYWFIIISLKNNKEMLIDKTLYVMMMALPICVLLTGTRSAIIALLVASLGFISLNSIKNNKFYVVLVISGIILFFPYLTLIYDGFVYSDEVSGSSYEMRQGQWEIAMYYMAQNFWLGNGVGYCSSLLNANEAGLFGAEGMWLPIMIDRGMFGVISVAMAYLLAGIYLVKRKQYSELWVLASFWVFKTITTVAGVEQSYYLLIVVFLVRYKEIYNKKINKNIWKV